MLHTRCPHCHAAFKATPEQISAAHGLVRCGGCKEVFSALANEIKTTEPASTVGDVALGDMEQAFAESMSAVPEEHPEDATSTATAPSEANPIHSEADANASDTADLTPTIPFLEAANDERIDVDESDEARPPGSDIDLTDNAAITAIENAFAANEENAAEFAEETEFAEENPFAEEFTEFDAPSLEVEVEHKSINAQTPVDILMEDYPEDADNSTASKAAIHQHLAALRSADFTPLTAPEFERFDAIPIALQSQQPRPLWRKFLFAALNLVFLLLLPAQWLYYQRHHLAEHPRFAALAPLVCSMASCNSAKPTPINPIYSQQLLVRTHPQVANALEVTFVFHNDTALPQPLPAVELIFNNVEQQPLANRLFAPKEYLPSELGQLPTMPAHSTLPVTLELQDPGKEAVNYTLSLHDAAPLAASGAAPQQ